MAIVILFCLSLHCFDCIPIFSNLTFIAQVLLVIVFLPRLFRAKYSNCICYFNARVYIFESNNNNHYTYHCVKILCHSLRNLEVIEEIIWVGVRLNLSVTVHCSFLTCFWIMRPLFQLSIPLTPASSCTWKTWLKALVPAKSSSLTLPHLGIPPATWHMCMCVL